LPGSNSIGRWIDSVCAIAAADQSFVIKGSFQMSLFSDLMFPLVSAGVDEVGRGPLAGPVYAAAVVIGAGRIPAGLTDSKKLSARQRHRFAAQIRLSATAWAVAYASVAEIDELNILRASHLAMQRAVAGLDLELDLLLVDGNLLPQFAIPALPIVKGDSRIAAISAASVLAKVARDAEMKKLAQAYPGYGFERHKGYPTAAHKTALQQLGPTPEHRRSFAPVRAQIELQTKRMNKRAQQL
jgi:ribonuclease HII